MPKRSATFAPNLRSHSDTGGAAYGCIGRGAPLRIQDFNPTFLPHRLSTSVSRTGIEKSFNCRVIASLNRGLTAINNTGLECIRPSHEFALKSTVGPRKQRTAKDEAGGPCQRTSVAHLKYPCTSSLDCHRALGRPQRGGELRSKGIRAKAQWKSRKSGRRQLVRRPQGRYPRGPPPRNSCGRGANASASVVRKRRT